MNHTLTRWLPRRLLRPVWACGACAAGSLAFAQAPAAKLLPAVAVDPPAPAVARGSAPAPAPPAGYQFQAPASVPAPGATARTSAEPQPTLWGGVKSLFPQKPVERPEPAKATRPSDPKPAQPTSLTGNAPPPAPPSPPPPQTYAGSPAYRWYGYGTPAPGTNPFAPEGRYPQAPGRWLTQTGATPGAFPVPAGGVPQESAIPQEPPPRPGPERWDTPPPRVALAETPRTGDTREPAMPSGSGVPLPSATGGPTPDVNWQPVSAGSRVPIAASPPTEPMPVPG